MKRIAPGEPVPRTEDRRFLIGRGRYVDDVTMPGQVYAEVVRSPHAHARILSVGTADARAAPGVLAVLTGADYEVAGLGNSPCPLPRQRRDGSPMPVPPYPALVRDRARTTGDAVALVVAETRSQARDAAERVEVDYEPLPAVTATAAAMAADAPRVWEDLPDNECFTFALGDPERVDAAFAAADHVTRLRMSIPRVGANPIEPRAALGVYDAGCERYVLHAGLQSPHRARRDLAESYFGLPESRFRVVTPDVGGSFGMKGQTFGEYVLVLWAARLVGRPVKWLATRSESLASDDQARDNVTDAELALDRDGRFLGLRVRTTAAVGAYLSSRAPIGPSENLGTLAGVYTTPAIRVEVTAVFTHTRPTAPYRGAGRPEAALVIERLVEAAARETGVDPVTLRRRNIIAPDRMPYATALTFTYDGGEFEKNMDAALDLVDHAGFPARRADAAARGRLRGFGISNTIERAAGAMWESAEIRFDPTGSLSLAVGSVGHGQGHETVYRQLLSHRLGVDPDSVHVITGDTDQVVQGIGTFGSRTASLAGSAIVRAAEAVVDRARAIAAHLLEAGDAPVNFEEGTFRVADSNRFVPLVDVARAAFLPAKLPPGTEIGLHASATFNAETPNFPNGCHACEVEVDPETGRVGIVRYGVADDVGTVLNPLIAKGQIHGGVAQGAGEALMERIAYDEESGELVSGSFLDYCMPRAGDLCPVEVVSLPVPTATNPLGVKGVGETGLVGSLPAVINAVVDALAPLGVRHLDPPATPLRVWQAIRRAGDGGG